MSNYPDDIRSHDHDPRSPFYDNKEDAWLEEASEQIANDWVRMDAAFGDHGELREKFMRFFCEAASADSGSVEEQDSIAMAFSAWQDIALAEANAELARNGLPEPDEDEPRHNRFLSMFHRRQAD